jgi:NTE family protein
VPGIFPTVKIDGRELMDGAIAANTPLRLAVQLGATRIIVLPTGYACALKGAPKGVIAKALHLAPALCPLEVSPHDFSASRQLIERAMRSTRDWIAGGRPGEASPRTGSLGAPPLKGLPRERG